MRRFNRAVTELNFNILAANQYRGKMDYSDLGPLTIRQLTSEICTTQKISKANEIN